MLLVACKLVVDPGHGVLEDSRVDAAPGLGGPEVPNEVTEGVR